MIRSTIGVVTNARPDHAELMGTTVGEVAAALGATVPRSAVLVMGPTGGADILARVAQARGSRVVHAVADEGEPEAWAGRPWMAENAGVALAVVRELGIGDEIARRGMLAARPDPGALRAGRVEVAGRRVDYVDASAANDPQSLGLILGATARSRGVRLSAPRGPPGAPRPVLRGGPVVAGRRFGHRHRRPAGLGHLATAARAAAGRSRVVRAGTSGRGRTSPAPDGLAAGGGRRLLRQHERTPRRRHRRRAAAGLTWWNSPSASGSR